MRYTPAEAPRSPGSTSVLTRGRKMAIVVAILLAAFGYFSYTAFESAQSFYVTVDELVEHVRTLVRRLEPWPSTPEVALAGGLIEEEGPLRSRVIEAIEGLPCQHLARTPDGARGACSLAMGLVGPTDGTQVR